MHSWKTMFVQLLWYSLCNELELDDHWNNHIGEKTFSYIPLDDTRRETIFIHLGVTITVVLMWNEWMTKKCSLKNYFFHTFRSDHIHVVIVEELLKQILVFKITWECTKERNPFHSFRSDYNCVVIVEWL